MADIGACLSSDKMDWRTPQTIITPVCAFARLVGADGIDLDPCSGPGSLVSAHRAFTEADDGLAQDWTSDGVVYVNPPYGRSLASWMGKCATEARSGRACHIIALVPARTDTKWWRVAIRSADSVCFWNGRVKFVGADHGAPFPSALIYFGPGRAEFRRAFEDKGWVVTW